MSIKNNIKKMRTNKNMTLEQLANMIGTTKQTIQKYENGTIKNIPQDKISLLAQALGTTPTYLYYWEASPDESITAEQALQAVLIIEKYAYTSRRRPRVSFNECEYNALLNDIVKVINSKADQIYIETQEVEKLQKDSSD